MSTAPYPHDELWMSGAAQATMLPPSASMREAMEVLERTGAGLVVVVDDRRHVLGTVSDGDVRRGILDGLALETPVERVMGATPLCARAQTPTSRQRELLVQRGVSHMPIVDDTGRLIDIRHLTDLVPMPHEAVRVPVADDVRVVILAGGRGQRLGSLTERVPKPMLHVGDRPLLETLIEQLASQGLYRITIAVHYLAEAITRHFGDGSAFGVEIDYVHEDTPLGTAGAIRLAVPHPEGPLLVLNADILTTLRFGELVAHHRREGNALTVALTAIDTTMPFGVLKLDGTTVVAIEEKPASRHFASAGIYVVSPEILEHVGPRVRVDMPEVIGAAIAARRKVGGFPLLEFWSDIGHPDDYDSAQLEYERRFGGLRGR